MGILESIITHVAAAATEELVAYPGSFTAARVETVLSTAPRLAVEAAVLPIVVKGAGEKETDSECDAPPKVVAGQDYVCAVFSGF